MPEREVLPETGRCEEGVAGADSPLKATEDKPEEMLRAVEEPGWTSCPLTHPHPVLRCWAAEVNQM